MKGNMKNIKLWAVCAVSALLLLAGVSSTSAATVTVGVLPDTYAPTVLSETGDTAKVELGLKFSPTTDGRIKGIQFYQNAANSGVTSVSLWGNGGTRLIKLTIPATGPVGWRTIAVDRALTAGRMYTVSVSDTNGRYPYTPSYFTSERVENGITVGANAGVFRYGSTSQFPSEAWNGSNYLVDLVYETTVPDPEPAPTPTPEPTPDPTPPPASASQYNYLGRSFPDASTTGVPAGTVLSPYTGPCTITVPDTTIDAKSVGCSLIIKTTGVVITRSEITGIVYNETTSTSFTISDSRINMGAGPGAALGDGNFTATRVHVTGGQRGVMCYFNCTIQDSYVTAGFADQSGTMHMGGVRMGYDGTIRGNTIICDAPAIADAGCSGALTGYGDWTPIERNTIDGNLFIGPNSGYCAYGGASTGKPFSDDSNHMVFTNNVWQRGPSGKCGYFGPITSFDSAAPGNVWSGNFWEDGAPVAAAN